MGKEDTIHTTCLMGSTQQALQFAYALSLHNDVQGPPKPAQMLGLYGNNYPHFHLPILTAKAVFQCNNRKT